MNRRWIIGWISLMAAGAACALEYQDTPAVVTLTPQPSASSLMSREKTPDGLSAVPTGGPTHVPCQPPATASIGLRYNIHARLDWTAHTVQVEQVVAYRNDTGYTQQDLVFTVETNRDPGGFSLDRVATADGRPIDGYTLDGVRLAVPLLEDLHANCEVGLKLEYHMALPSIQSSYSLGYWGYSSRQVNLGMWFPTVAVFDPKAGWVTPRVYFIGEQGMLQAADFVVEIQVDGAPDSLRVAGPGIMTQPGKQTWRFELSGGREVALSLSEEFKMLSTSTADDIKVELYYLADTNPDTLDAPRHALTTAADALSWYEELYGPYPYSRLVVVQGDFPDGMEFSGLVFVGDAWFRYWKGVPDDWLTIITAHEVAHQWWYALVGSDQGNTPYLDEALAIYSEELFFEHYYPDKLEWWWNFRVKAYAPTGYVDSTVYQFDTVRSYIDAVYLRGALMLQALRQDVGEQDFFAWLRQYAEVMRGQLATPASFWETLPDGDYALTEQTRGEYLSQPNVLGQADQLP